MLFSVEQAFVGRDEKRAPLKTPAWEAITVQTLSLVLSTCTIHGGRGWNCNIDSMVLHASPTKISPHCVSPLT